MAKNAPFSFDKERPLELCAGESLRANTALHHYMAMGPGRSIRKLFDKYKRGREQTESRPSAENALINPQAAPGPSPTPPTLRLATLFDWSDRFQWQARIERWEALQDAEDEREWAERRKKLRSMEWEKSTALFDLADQILDEAPKFIKTRRRVIKDTGQEIITMELDAYLALKAIEIASKTGRLASEMETERKDINLKAENLKGYAIISPDDWDDKDDSRPATPVPA